MASVMVVTGGSRGIGHAVCERLAGDGHRVLLVARDPERGRQAAAGIQGNVEFVAGDLTTVASVRRLAEELRERCPRVDVLVHNAGIWPSRRVLTADGVEESFAVNHLAPFLLNRLLEDRLGRVVQVSAGLYVKGRAEPGRTSVGADFSSLRTYADTKLCNLLTVPLFAERWREAGVTIDAVHPGVIRTGLGDRSGPAGWLLKVVKRRWATVEQGAGPVVALVGGTGTGRYFDQTAKVPLQGPALDGELARRIWDEAQALTAAR
ncbi:SDR family NAD(P)-dependent oxidoreductase [Nonomuraea gerenzanensis]|uniref:Putative oxidoreductase n=1 Tax=Nonomuraea gerenzanensis TaxID=93944 RepID=A0A1M4EF78_9ACTN|nr:SDR family NAD(P)-dependent oxidoreductase [Nonomuraea gerenzanensis]UBU09242.1 SDR family NAD(P)-dependent oxidoreductase [Nonomuraea gerenzanensis]SBO97641.1 putative oxidoreductase [Nonomuraea gerenzanensis]